MAISWIFRPFHVFHVIFFLFYVFYALIIFYRAYLNSYHGFWFGGIVALAEASLVLAGKDDLKVNNNLDIEEISLWIDSWLFTAQSTTNANHCYVILNIFFWHFLCSMCCQDIDYNLTLFQVRFLDQLRVFQISCLHFQPIEFIRDFLLSFPGWP